MFMDEYQRKFDAVRPDLDLRRRIEERMDEEMRENESKVQRIGMRPGRRMVAVLVAVLILALAATAVAVVQGNLLRTKATPHKSAAHQVMPFPTSAACKFLDLPPVSLRNLQSHLSKNSFAC